MMLPVVEARALTKYFADKPVVQGIDFTIQAGQCFGFLGPNGAGKTTTLKMMLGISPITSGSLKVLDHPIPQQARPMRAKVGVVPQMNNLDVDFNVTENLQVYGRYFGLSQREINRRIPQLLEFVGLQHEPRTAINHLSGGMQRRLVIARALINDPDLLILDEPTTALDPQARHLIWERMRSLRQQGKTLVLTTHYMEEAERLCDELVIMVQGKILAQGSPRALIQRYVEPEVVEIRGDLPEQARSGLPACRIEVIGETRYCYTAQAQTLLVWLAQLPQQPAFLHRPANLEDVFLRLTGHDLNT